MRTERTTVEYDHGDVLKYVNGYLHCGNGPAVKTKDGYELWFCHGRLHRSDGPAYLGPGGIKEYWLGGEQVSKESFIEMQASWIKDLQRQLQMISDDKGAITNALFAEIRKSDRRQRRAFAVRARSLFWHKIASGMGEMNVALQKKET